MSIPDAAKLARYDDLANTVEELHDECMVLRQAIRQTLDENGHLADGEVCTLLPLKLVLRKIGTPWDGDELWPPELKRKTEAPHNAGIEAP